jgi:hypothetical protein
MDVSGNMEISFDSAEQPPAESQFSHARFVRMSNPELLRFGMSAKLFCSEAQNLDDPRKKTLLAQLNLARVEWNRRHPKLPLRNSF